MGQASEDQKPEAFVFRAPMGYRSNDAALVEGVEGLLDLHYTVKCLFPTVGLSHVASIRIHECVTSSELSKTSGQQRVLEMLQSQEDFATYNLCKGTWP